MGAYRKFALNLTTVAVPSLIAFDLVYVYPMSSMSGFVNYLSYTAGSNKGDTTQGTMFNSVLGLGNVDANYTSSKVVEAIATTADGKIDFAWTPVAGSVEVQVGGAWQKVEASADGTYATVEGATRVKYEYDNVVIPQNDIPLLNVKMEHIDLYAKARRIAIYYSQIAAYQA